MIENKKNEPFKNIKIIWTSFFVSILFYFLVIYLCEKGIIVFERGPTTILGLKRYLNYLAGIFVLTVLFIRRFLYFPSSIVKQSLDRVKMRWFVLDLVVYSLGEAVSILGIVHYFLFLDFKNSLFFLITGALVLLLLYPFELKDIMREDTYKRMRKEAGIYD